MKNLKKFSVLMIFSFFLNFSIFSKETKKILKVAYVVAPPLTFKSDKNEDVGAVIDFYKNYIMPNTPYEFKFEPMPLSRIFVELKSGDIDMLATAAFFTKKDDIILGKNIFYESKNYLITKKDFKYDKITSIDQLKGVIIGSKKDGPRAPFLAKNMLKLNFEDSASADSVYSAPKKLLAGRVDALYAYTYISLMYVIKKEGLLNKVKLVELPGETVKVFAGYSPKLDKKIRETIENQIYIQIHEKKVNLNDLIEKVK